MAANDKKMEEKIIQAARTLFMKNGFAETNMSDIAAAVGINRPALHYYFRTKEKMFQAVFGNIILSLAPELQCIVLQDKPISERIQQVVDAYYHIFSANPHLPLFIAREMDRDMPHLVNTVRDLQLEGYFHNIINSLENEMERGKLKRVPLPFVFFTLYSLLTFPFLTKNFSLMALCEKRGDFEKMLGDWKQHIVGEMDHLLSNSN